MDERRWCVELSWWVSAIAFGCGAHNGLRWFVFETEKPLQRRTRKPTYLGSHASAASVSPHGQAFDSTKPSSPVPHSGHDPPPNAFCNNVRARVVVVSPEDESSHVQEVHSDQSLTKQLDCLLG